MKKTIATIVAMCMTAVMIFTACTSEETNVPDDPNNPSNPDNPNNPSLFTKRTFNSVKDYVDFMPVGVYVYDYENNTWKSDIDVYSKTADGALIYGQIEDKEGSEYYGETIKFSVWKGSIFQGVHHRAGVDFHRTAYWKTLGEFPGQILTQDQSTGDIDGHGLRHATAGGHSRDIIFMEGFTPFARFITSDDCEKVVFEKNDVIKGISCKKYVYKNGAYTNSYWVLEDGFCLQFHSELFPATNFNLVEAETSAPNPDYVIENYYRAGDNPFPLVPLAEMYILVHVNVGGGWIAPEREMLIPWTDGGINYMILSYEFKNGGVFLHTYDIDFNYDDISDSELFGYIDKVKTIQNMKVTRYSDTDSEEYRQEQLALMYQLFPNETEEQIQVRYQALLEVLDQLGRTLDFEADNSIEHPQHSYYYVSYDINSMEWVKTFRMQICWVWLIVG